MPESPAGDLSGCASHAAKFLLRHSRRPPTKMKAWGTAYMLWVRGQPFERFAENATFVDDLAQVAHAAERIEQLEKDLDHAVAEAPPAMKAVIEAPQALRGIAKLSAVTVVAEVGQLSRFAHPSQMMGYSGTVPSEHSSGGPGKTHRGGLTKTGNAHLRRVLVEASWNYRYRPAVQGNLRARQRDLSEEIKAIAWKAQLRLHRRYRHLADRGKPLQQVSTAVGRELLGFIWAGEGVIPSWGTTRTRRSSATSIG